MSRRLSLGEVIPSTPNLDEYRDVWFFATYYGGELDPGSFEALAAARSVSSKVGMRVGGVIVGSRVGRGTAEELIFRGADYVVVVDHGELGEYDPLAYAMALEEVVREYRPWAFIFMADEVGRDVAPRLAYRLKTGLATDNIDFDVEDFYSKVFEASFGKVLVQVRPDFATRIAKIYTPRHRPQIASLRPGYFKPPPRDPGRRGRVFTYTPRLEGYRRGFRVLSERALEVRGRELEEADFIISLGLGILTDAEGNPADPLEAVGWARKILGLVGEELGVKTALGASRALIYADVRELRDVVTHDMQVGQTGKTVAPTVYIAAGISGAVQHRVGILRARNVVSINIDPEAPIHEISHYVVLEDLHKALPRIYEEFRKALKA